MKAEGKTKQEVVSEFRCGEILRAARRVFAAKGFSLATVDDIAEGAGVAKGTLYLYFPSKREIYMAAFREGVSELAAASREAVEKAGTMREKLRAYVATRLRYVEEHRDFYKIYHAEFGNLTHPSTTDDWFLNVYREQLEMLGALLREAVERGEVRPLPTGAMASAVYQMVKGIMLRRILGWSDETVDEDVEALCEIVWSGIKRS
jgi:AcrR family transcriptional regulator